MMDRLGPYLSHLPAAALRIGALLVAFAMGAFFFSGNPAPTGLHENGDEATVWTCSMDPQVRLTEPGPCPICGMDLIPANGAVTSERTNRVVLSERARALARLRTTAVRRQGDASANVRLLGRIEPDETTRKNVTTWVGGRIDRLHVNVTGEKVRSGQVIATLYSPEIYAAHQDLITANNQVARLAGSSDSTRRAATAALGAARERLRLLGVPSRELERMEQAKRPTQAVSIRSSFSGTVIERVATEGAYVETGAPLYRVADLDKLWVQLDAYESDLPRLSLGQAVSLTVEGVPGQVFEGTVAFIDPTLDPQRRTSRVRVEVVNVDQRLRPGMFADAVVSAATPGSDSPLVVPATAALFTGKRSIVYVEVNDEEQLAYEPRTVRLGPRLGDVYPVVAGLSEGERVVSKGAFAIDADLQIRGGASMMAASDDRGPGRWDAAVQISSVERDKLTPVVGGYLEIQRALAEDDHPTASAAAERLQEAVSAVSLSGTPEWREVADALRVHARHVAVSKDIEGARSGFEPLSAAIESLLRRFGNPLDQELQVAFCSMAKGNEGARWVQEGEGIDNAYFGSAMRNCGEIRSEIAPGAFLASPEKGSRPPAPAGHVH